MIGSVLRRLKRAVPERHPLRLGWHAFKAALAAARHGFPARRLRIIGITGTDGKTTTAAMTSHILHAAGVPVGAVSTSFYRVKGKTEENPTHKTSLSPFLLQGFLRRCAAEGCRVVVVEASSHGLVQHRLDFLWPEVAAITNTSPEHLDYHGTMDRYRADKGILFRMLRGKGTAVTNADDETHALYAAIPASRRIAYSAAHAFPEQVSERELGVWAEDVRLSASGSEATVRSSAEDGAWPLALRIPGRFNVENALCAIACAHAVGVPITECVAALADFPGVPGRMERIDEGQPFSVFVDFTVTPKSYEETLAAARSTLEPGRRLLVLTGSCGNRMREKRPQIGRIVSERADVLVVTEDETLTEDPMAVIDEVWAGVDASRCDARKIPDRREAIRFLFREARPGDAVVLCGMGACTTMQTLSGLRPWDERRIAREELRALAGR